MNSQKLETKFLTVALVFVLASVPGPALLGKVSAPTLSLPLPNQTLAIDAGYFIPIQIDTFSSPSVIAYTARSDIPVSTALMNAQQFSQFNNSNNPDITNSLSYSKGTSVDQNVSVPTGAYYLVFFNEANFGTANINFSYAALPHTPFEDGPRLPPQPTGLASFGILNVSGKVVPYQIKTYSVVGIANISSMEAHNASAPALNDTVSGATLQLNSMLVVNENNSAPFVYWAQATPDFVTDANQVSFADNVWNATDIHGFLSNQSITSSNGNGVFPAGPNSTAQDYYGYQSSNLTYSVPLDLQILMNESVVEGTGVLLQMGAQILANGSQSAPQPVQWFDNITIHAPGVQSAYFYTSGNDSTPIGTFYDTEFVFGGEGNLEATQFNQMNSTLGLFYRNESSGQLAAFPSYYSFGGDTGEAADNLHVIYSGNGTVAVTVGTPDYVYLNAAAPAGGNTTVLTNASQGFTTSQQATTTLPAQTSITSSDTGSAAAIVDSDYLLVPLVAIFFLVVIGRVARRREKNNNRI